LAESVRIVDDWRDEIHRLDQRQVIVDEVHGGVVGRFGSDQKARILTLA
jgi:hypothetical protein